jgi:ADP-ribose pyrophosphatase
MNDARLLRTRRVHDGRVVKLDLDEVVLPNGNDVTLEIVRHAGAAAAVPMTEGGSVVMVRQYRHATGSWLLEVPAGKLDRPGEPPEACAKREVEEETGYVAADLVPLGWIWTTPGFSDERIWIFLARGLVPGRAALERDEVLSVEEIPLAEAVQRALSGEIADAKSVCAILRAAALSTESR